MTVKELINALLDSPMDKEIHLYLEGGHVDKKYGEWCSGWVFDIDSVEHKTLIKFTDWRKKTELKQGKWIDGNNNIVPFDKDGCPRGWCKCSECGDYLSASEEYAVRGFFCPNCGAKMFDKDTNARSKEPQADCCETCRFDDKYGEESICSDCSRHYSDCYEPKTEPQTERSKQ